MPSDVAVFHPGVQHSWQTALALQQLGRLNVYATSIFYQPDRWPYRVEGYLPPRLAARVHAEFRRFDGPPLDAGLLETFGVAEWLERLANRAGWKKTGAWLDAWGNRRFGHDLHAVIARRRPTVLWGYNGSSREVFADPANAGRLRILDRTIGDWRVYNAEMDAIHDRYADFFASPDYRVPAAVIARDDEEYEAADIILAGSSFAAATVADAARDRRVAERVRVLHYCYDEALFADMPPPSPRHRNAPVRFLCVGQANVRKGIHLILDCFARVPATAATLTIVGNLQVPPATFARYADRLTYRPTVARADVPALLADADVLLFPSYFEGAGLVLYEALAAGCALIQSANAARAVTPETGILLNELSTAALLGAVMTLIDDRPRLAAMRAAAQAEAARYSFARYRDAIGALLAAARPMIVEVWHNVLWSRYKGRVFSALHALAQRSGEDVRFFQMAETEGGRVALGEVDLRYHDYPFELLFRGAIERVPRWRSVPRFFWRALISRADFVVIAGYASPPDWAQLAGLIIRGIPRGVFCDSTLGESQPGRLRRWAKRFFFRRVDLIFCYGERARDMALQFGARPGTLVRRCQAAALPEGYDAAAVPALRRAGGPPRFLYVGRLAAEKNLGILLAAFARFRAGRPEAELRLAGDGPLRARLEAEAGAGVTFLGALDQHGLAAEYLAASALVLPSLREPWGLVVNEALSYGCPVLVSERCGCVPELVRPGITGLAFDPFEPDALVAAMTALIAAPPAPASCLAVIAEFTPEAAAGNILDGIRNYRDRTAR